MKSFILSAGLLIVTSTSFAQPSLRKAANEPKRNTTAEYNYFADATKDVAAVLSNTVFKDYAGYTIDNIRQGEIGEAQAYFVRLVKPFSSDSNGVCFAFIGTSKLSGKPRNCDKAE